MKKIEKEAVRLAHLSSPLARRRQNAAYSKEMSLKYIEHGANL